MTKRGLNDGDVQMGAMTPHYRGVDMRRTARWLGYLVKTAEEGDLPEGVTDAMVQEAKQTLETLQATDVATTALIKGVDGQATFALWNQARRVMHAMAPIIAVKLAQHADDKDAPGNPTIILAMAKGLGLLVPGEGQTSEEREAAITRKDISEMSDDEINRRLAGMEDE